MRWRTMPTISTPGSSRGFLQRHCTRQARACAMCWPMCARSNWPRTATSAASITEQAGDDRGRPVRRLHAAFARCCSARRWACRSADCSDVLFCDTALALQVPVRDARVRRSPRTPSRPRNRPAGSGTSACRRDAASAHVYSSRRISDEEADRELRAYIGPRRCRPARCARSRSARATARPSGSATASRSGLAAGLPRSRSNPRRSC